ncbi:uncharacterized protein TNCV_2170291 [Trichonephila clavipes]|nr:uncharacterized protein TNCV_2170291 [Trichonephila clavipes]
MQDEATPHIRRKVKALFSAKFGDDRDYPDIFWIAWPFHSLDINLCDFWLWVFLKDRVCRGVIRTLPDLKASNIRPVAEISCELLRPTIENDIMRFRHVIDVNGAHIERIFYN